MGGIRVQEAREALVPRRSLCSATSRVRPRWTLSTLLLLGCGARTTLEEPAPLPPAPTLVCGADLPVEDAYLGPPGDACGAAPTLEGAALVALADFTVWTARGDSAEPITKLFDDEPHEGLSTTHGVVASRGAFSAVAAFAHRPDDATAHLEVVLLQRTTSAVLVRKTWEMPYEGFGNELRLFGNNRGLFVVGARLGDSIVTRVIDVAGRELTAIEGALPVGDPDAAGHVPVVDETTPPERPTSWLDPCSGERTPVTAPAAYGLTAVQGALVGFDSEGPALVVETSQDRRRITLPADVTSPFEITTSGKALLATGSPMGFVVADLATGAITRRDIVLPNGYVRYASFASAEGFDSNATELRITSSGGLVLPMRDAAEGYAFISDDGATWEALGSPIGEVYRAFLAEAGGTVLHFGNDFATTLPPWAPPAPGSGRIDGMSLQVIRPASGVRADVLATNTRHYVLTEDGGCLGLAIGGQMITLSASDGTQRSYVIGADTFDGVDAFAFAVRQGTTLLAQ